MRRVLLSLLAAMSALTGIAALSSTPAGAEGLVDLSASSVSNPAAVSPPGALVFYTATFKNEGAVSVDGIFTNKTTGGTLFRSFSSPGCTSVAAGTSNPSTTCTATLAPGATKVIEVIVQTPLTAPASVTNASTARVNPGLVQVVDLVTTNNDSSVTTPVQAATVGSAGFVTEGGSLAYKKHVLTVRDADLGIVAYLSDTTAPEAADCGGVPCKIGLHADFDQNPRFAGIVEIDVNFGTTDPCRGLGNDCNALFFRKLATDATKPVPACGTQLPNEPCLESRYRGANQEFHFVVVQGTDDPDLLAPVKNLTA